MGCSMEKLIFIGNFKQDAARDMGLQRFPTNERQPSFPIPGIAMQAVCREIQNL